MTHGWEQLKQKKIIRSFSSLSVMKALRETKYRRSDKQHLFWWSTAVTPPTEKTTKYDEGYEGSGGNRKSVSLLRAIRNQQLIHVSETAEKSLSPVSHFLSMWITLKSWNHLLTRTFCWCRVEQISNRRKVYACYAVFQLPATEDAVI